MSPISRSPLRTERRLLAAVVLAAAGSAPAAAAQGVKVDETLPYYEKASGVAGSIKSVGSDTMNNLMTLWGEAFNAHYPNVRIEIEGKGSTTAPPALIEGTATFGPMSREMKSKEIDDFTKRHGYAPTELRAAIDMLAVYVHKDNPIAQRGLSLQQVDAIFSKNRLGGRPTPIETWGDLGLAGEWSDKPISLYGRNSASGTYGFFKDHALFKGDFRDEVKEMPGSSAVVQGIADDRYGIGYSGIGYRTANVAAVALAYDASSEMIPATPDYAYSGEYPLSRFLFVYVNQAPNTKLDPLRAQFLRYVFSREGQEDVLKDGYYPVTGLIAQAELAKVGQVIQLVEAAAPKRP